MGRVVNLCLDGHLKLCVQSLYKYCCVQSLYKYCFSDIQNYETKPSKFTRNENIFEVLKIDSENQNSNLNFELR